MSYGVLCLLANRLTTCVVFLLAIAVASNLMAAIEVDGASDQMDLGKSSYYLFDPEGELSIADLIARAEDHPWQFADNRSPNFGFNRSPIWYRVDLLNTDNHEIEKLLSLTSRAVWSVDIYAQVEDEPISVIAKDVGLKSSYFNRPIDHYFVLNRIKLPPGKVLSLYYRFQSFADSSFYLGLHEESSFLARDRRFMLMQGAVYGLILCMTLITLLIFTLSRDVSFFYYFLLSCSVIAAQTIQNGLLHMLFPSAGSVIPSIWYGNAIAFSFVLTLFTFNFNKTQKFMPRVAWATYVLMVVLSVVQAFIYVGGYEQLIVVVSAGFAVLLLILLGTSYFSYRQGYKPAIFSIFGVSALFVAISGEMMQGLGFFHTQEELAILIMVGLVIMASIFAIGLGSYYNYIREETTRLRMEEEVKKVRAQKAELDAVRTNEFLANMSHEIRTPINGILGMSEILSHTRLDESQSFYNRMVITSGKTLLCVINDILDFSKLRSNKVNIEKISFSMDEIFANSMAAHSMQAQAKNIRLTGHYQTGAPIHFFGDPYRIQQVINNLLSNAIKFTMEGEVNFSIEGDNLDGGLFNLSISVRDTGVGIPEDKIDHLFEAFEQADTSITRKFGGTGLGLTIARQLVNLMGGSMGVESSQGKGSCFTVRLPLAIDSEKERPQQPETSSTSEQNQLLPQFPGVTLLVAEDNEINRNVIKVMLGKLGVNITLVENGQQAVDCWQQHPQRFNGILMDCEMPVMDGYACTRCIRLLEQEQGFAKTPIVALTAHVLPEYKTLCIDSGMDGIVVKPVSLSSLAKAIGEYFLDASN